MNPHEQHPVSPPTAKPESSKNRPNGEIPSAQQPDFASPNSNIPECDQQKTTVVINKHHFRQLHEWHGRPGTFRRTVAIVVEKLVTSLQSYGLDKYDPDTFERLVLGATIVLPGRGVKGTYCPECGVLVEFRTDTDAVPIHHDPASGLPTTTPTHRTPPPIADLTSNETNSSHVVRGVAVVRGEGKGNKVKQTISKRTLRGADRQVVDGSEEKGK